MKRRRQQDAVAPHTHHPTSAPAAAHRAARSAPRFLRSRSLRLRLGLCLSLGGVVACHAPEMAPETWPLTGCTASSSSSGRVYQTHGWLLAPDDPDAVRLRVTGLRPPEDCVAAVVLVPGGLQAGLPLLEAALAQDLADTVAVFAWDPRGRGESDGTEDANGSRGQDDLAAVLRWVASQEGIDPAQVVLYSRSFGAALAAGALARHADLSPVAWLDYEGPGWLSEDLEHAQGQSVATLRDTAATADDPAVWWAEREPAGLVGAVVVPYRRAQGYPDHALGSRLQHVLAMVNGAREAPSVRYNGEAVVDNLTDEQARAAAIPPGLDPDGPILVEMIREILAEDAAVGRR